MVGTSFLFGFGCLSSNHSDRPCLVEQLLEVSMGIDAAAAVLALKESNNDAPWKLLNPDFFCCASEPCFLMAQDPR